MSVFTLVTAKLEAIASVGIRAGEEARLKATRGAKAGDHAHRRDFKHDVLYASQASRKPQVSVLSTLHLRYAITTSTAYSKAVVEKAATIPL
jgi:hypothetical protein